MTEININKIKTVLPGYGHGVYTGFAMQYVATNGERFRSSAGGIG